MLEKRATPIRKGGSVTLATSSAMFRRAGAVLAVSALCFGAVSGVAQSQPTPEVSEAEGQLWTNPKPDDLSRARQVLETAALAGQVDAQRLLGQHLLHGWVLEQDVEEGLMWLEKAIAAGNADAESELGQSLLWGQDVPQDLRRAAELLASAADKGQVAAQRVLGEQLIGGWTMARDPERGLTLLQQAIAAGDAEAHVALGKLQLYGTGIKTDRKQALAHFEAAAEAGNGHGLAVYGEYWMWRFSSPAKAEAMLVRAANMGATEAWVTLAHGAMYGYLGGGRKSRAKFNGYAAKAREAGEDEIAVLEATRNMWGINMRADGHKTVARLTGAAENGNVAAAKFLIELLRDGNGLNVRRDLKAANAALERYAPLLGDTQTQQYALTFRASAARTPKAYAPVAMDYVTRTDLKTDWLAQQIVRANPNVAFYILQQRFRETGSYSGKLNGYATRSTLRAVYKACLGLDHPERCNDSVMRSDIIADLVAQ